MSNREEVEKVKRVLFGNSAVENHGDVWSWVSINLLPNKECKHVFLNVFAVNDANILETANGFLFSFCSVFNNLAITVDNKASWYPHDKFSHIIEYSVVSDKEVEIINKLVNTHNSIDFKATQSKKSIFSSFLHGGKDNSPEKKMKNSILQCNI